MRIETLLLLICASPTTANNTVVELQSRIKSLEQQLSNCEIRSEEFSGRKRAQEQAEREAKASVQSCDDLTTCETCSTTPGCGWCLGERACVPDEAWMCQGEEDHVGVRVGTATCPDAPDDPEPLLVKEPPKEPPFVAENTQPGTGICADEGSACKGQKICDCSSTFPATPHHCSCGPSQGDMQGCCNCKCGICDEICGKSAAPKQEPRKDGEAGNVNKDKDKEASNLAREELLRVRLEMDLEAAKQEVDVDLEADGSVRGPWEEDIKKCENVKERAKDPSNGLDNPYETLKIKDAATTAEIRRAYRKMTLELHPDKHNKNLCGEEAQKAFTNLVNAHDLLSDPDRRAAFDMFGDGDTESFNTQWEYEEYGRKSSKNFYMGSRHITNIDEKLWKAMGEQGKKAKSNEHTRAHKIWIVEFYAPWCGGCQSFTPTFKTLAQKIAEHEPSEQDDWFGVDIEVGAINCEQNANLCQREFNIRKYPTIRLISPAHGTQHELERGDIDSMKGGAFEIAAEWLWLFSRARVEEIESKTDFEEIVMESESFHIVLFMDGETCGPCRSAKTNALRLSAGLMGSGADAVVSFVNCGRDSAVRSFCNEDVGIEGHGWAPHLIGYSAGDKEALGILFSGELLYNANEVPPHAALRMIER